MATSKQIINFLTKKLNDNQITSQSLYHQYVARCKDNGVRPECQDLHAVALMCDYKEGWVYYKCQELGIEYKEFGT